MTQLNTIPNGHKRAKGAGSANDEPTNVVYYEGERIYFRPIELADEAQFRQWINDPRVWRGLMHRPPMNACQEREFIESQGASTTNYVFGIVMRAGHRLIGSAGLSRIHQANRSAMFGIMIGDVAYQNRGFGTEAVQLALRYGFEELNLNRIALSVFSNNPCAIRCYQRAGFVHEGCLRQAMYRNGQYHHEYKFAILREEWENRLADSHKSD